MFRKFILMCFVSGIALTSLFAAPSSYFSLDPVVSKLRQYDGILYTKTGALSLSGVVDPSVSVLEFSGMTATWGSVYASGSSLSAINARFPSNASLTGGVYTISALDVSGAILGSEDIIIDKTPPKATNITYYDDNRNGKIDRLFVATDEPVIGPIATPYASGIAINTRDNGLVTSCEYCDISEFVTSATITATGISFDLAERDNIKSHLAINGIPGGAANPSDLKFYMYQSAYLLDRAGNIFKFTASVFPNSSTGIIDGTTGIDALDTWFLNGSNFSGALSVPRLDSRGKMGDLTLNGIHLSIAEDSYLGDGNALRIGTGARLSGDARLFLGSESRILSATGETLFGKNGFSSSFRMLSGSILSDVSTITESGITYNYEGSIAGSGVELIVDYVAWETVTSLFSGALSGSATLVSLPHELSGGNLRAIVSKHFTTGESASFSGVTLVFDTLTQSSVTFAAAIAATGSISDITRNSARLSGAAFRPNISGEMCYGTGELMSTGAIVDGAYAFSGLLAGTTYQYRLGFVPFPSWQEIVSETYSFQTLPALKIPPAPVFVFQSTTYLLDQNPALNDFTCDATHTDCKVNFDLTSSFSPAFPASEFFCELDFDLDLESGEEGKCNPNNVTFPRGHDYILHFSIKNLDDVHLVSERTLVLHVPLLGALTSSGVTLTDTGSVATWSVLIPPSPQSPGGGSSTPISISLIQIADPIITVQSGLDENNRCKKADCALNVVYVPKQSKEACLWYFPGGAHTAGTEKKCNPGYVHYPFGTFTATLRVYEQGNESNFREKELRFSNGTPEEIKTAIMSKTNHAPIATIKLQGTLGKTKKQSGQSVTCMGVETCSINLSGEESYDLDRDKLIYHWDFGNGETSDAENPKAITFVKGIYRVVLRTTDPAGLFSEDTFMVTVEGKWAKDPKNPIAIEENVLSLRITGASPNPLGDDTIAEWIEIENPLPTEVRLGGCSLDDTPEKGSDPFVFSEGMKIAPNAKKRWYKLQTKLNLNNDGDSVSLICGGRTVSSLRWDYSVPEGFIVTDNTGPFAGKITTQVLRVVDGDTIEIELYGKSEKVRLVGVDTPETVHPHKKMQYYGVEASNYAKKMLTGREVELEFESNPRDKYDRLLAYVWIDGVNFDLELIRLGYARAYLRYPFRYSKQFEKVGNEAEKNKVGLWADKELAKIYQEAEKEEKEARDEEIKKEDLIVMEDLMDDTIQTKTASEKLTDRWLDAILRLAKEDDQNNKNTSILDEGTGSIEPSISIVWQGKASKTRFFQWTNAIVCHTKKTCNLNFSASKTDNKYLLYEWDFGNGTKFSGANPGAIKYAIGSYKVTLRVFDIKTGAVIEDVMVIRIEKPVTKQKIKKAVALNTPKPSNWNVRPDTPKIESGSGASLTRKQMIISGTALSFLFFGGIGIIGRRRMRDGIV